MVSFPAIQLMIGTAVTDSSFRKGLLNGSRRQLLQTFPLSADEVETLMSIRAETLEQFADQVHATLIAPTQEPEIESVLYGSHRVYAP